ncbi:MAG: hypothetical protein P1P87_10220, partial [Trueperaceae bacterium]|nr:hypothetical protein [Trueperaceae bacterium]
MARVLRSLLALWLTGTAFAAAPRAPTCTDLVAALPASLEAADEVVVAVTIEQGGREVAYERSRVRRQGDEVTTEVLERRGLRRPDGADGGGGGGDGDAFDLLPCADHDLVLEDDGGLRLSLRDADPEAPVAAWTLRFVDLDGVWRPAELVAPFEVRLLFVPVRGRFVT